MSYSTIKSFHSHWDSKKNSEKYLKNVTFFYNNNYADSTALNELNHKKITSWVLFCQHLKGDAVKWYFNLFKITKENWSVLKQIF